MYNCLYLSCDLRLSGIFVFFFFFSLIFNTQIVSFPLISELKRCNNLTVYDDNSTNLTHLQQCAP